MPEVESAYSSRGCFRELSAVSEEKGKYALVCTMEIQKIHMVVHIFSGFALFTELM